MTEIQQRRNEIRKAALGRRNALTADERTEKSRALVINLVQTTEYQAAKIIMIYRSTKSEVSLEELEKYNKAHDYEKTFVYPLCISDTEMIALKPESEEAWKEGYKGIYEPLRERSTEYAPEDIDMIVCPCASFDDRMGRMGMGAGFYDRFLEKCPKAAVLTVAFECQRSDDLILQDWDKPMHAVVTEEKTHRRLKHLKVVGAIIEYGGRILCMQRGFSRYASTSYKYEFPGGKIEAGETRPQALMRELREEMDFAVDIKEEDYFGEVHYVYPEFEITMDCYLCHPGTDVFNRKEHINHVWLEPEKLDTLDWAAADFPIVEKLMQCKDITKP